VNGWNTELEDKQGGDRHSDFSDPGGDSIASEPGDDKFNVSDFEYNATETDVTETALVFAHYSVKEYLISDRIQKGHAARYGIQDDACNSMIAKSCLSYLLQFKFPVSIGLGTIETFKLARYAAEFWTHHARSAGEDADTLNGLIIDFLTNGDGAYFNSIRLYNEADRYRSYYCVIDLEGLETVQRAPSPLIYASLAGLTKIVYLLIKSPDVDVKARERGLYPYETALQAASGEGHTAIVELLLAAEADVNGRGGTAYSGGALHEASRKGHKAIVELLLAAGADVDARGWGATALQIASLYGHEGIVKLLIAAGADVDEQEYEDTALQGASQNGYEAIVKLLVAAGANVNIQGRGHKTALHAASRAGHEAIVELLLAAGADVNAWERDSTVLQIAARHGNEGVVKLLLAAGANVDAQGEELGTALQAAARYGYEAVVKLLLAAGADVNERGIVYDSPLHLAIESGCEAIVELLLAAGATKDIGSSEGDVSL
jgi:ankyrin repeat protein